MMLSAKGRGTVPLPDALRGPNVPMTWEISEQQKRNAAIEDGRVFGVIFEPWEMAWLEGSGVSIPAFIVSAIQERFSKHGVLPAFETWEGVPREGCDFCGEAWDWTGRVFRYILNSEELPSWAYRQTAYVHPACATTLYETFGGEGNPSEDKIAYQQEVKDRMLANLASRLGIDQG
jgi:hypothetical protein